MFCLLRSARALDTSASFGSLISSSSLSSSDIVEPGFRVQLSNLCQSARGFGISSCLNSSKRSTLRTECFFSLSILPFLRITYASDSLSTIVSTELRVVVWSPSIVQYYIISPGQMRLTVMTDCKMHLSNLCHSTRGFGMSS